LEKKLVVINPMQPEQLNSNRVYFTEFDRATYSQVAWAEKDVEEIVRSLERKMKLLALTKGHMVIATSHLLESELARELLLPYPELFSERIIVPALRDDYASCGAFLEAKQHTEENSERELYLGAEQQEMAQLLDESALPVRWHPGDTSGWLKKRLIGDLRDGNSLVTIHLQRQGLTVPEIICRELENLPTLSRGAIYLATQRHGNLHFRKIVNAYADFLYYLSGAKAVQSEGVLPQENIIDFSFTDLEEKTISLTEYEIFFKIFIDTVKTATSTHFPTDFLDALTIEDTIHLHRIANDEHFIKKYNLIQQRTKDGLTLNDPERLVLLMDELLEYEQELHSEYLRAIEAELPNRLRQKRTRRTGNVINSLASLIVDTYGVISGVKDLLVSGVGSAKADKLSSQLNDRIRKGVHALEWCIREKFENQPVMLRFVDEMKKRYAGKMEGEL
jgi:hypothetical protein